MAINAEWVVNNDGTKVYTVSHAKAIVRGNSTVDADLTAIDKVITQNESDISSVLSTMNTHMDNTKDIDTMSTNMTSLEGVVKTVQSNVSTANSQASTNKTNITNQQSSVSSLKTNGITSLSLSGTTLQGRNSAGAVKTSVSLDSILNGSNSYNLYYTTLKSTTTRISKGGSVTITGITNIMNYPLIVMIGYLAQNSDIQMVDTVVSSSISNSYDTVIWQFMGEFCYFRKVSNSSLKFMASAGQSFTVRYILGLSLQSV